MSLRNSLLSLALFCGLTVFASEAQAAKGVKKKTAAGAHVHHGVITNIEAHKNGTGTITIKTHSHKKKTAVGVAAAAVKTQHTHKFLVNQATVVAIAQGKNHQAAGIQAIRKGEHVAITASAHHADKVVIHMHQKTSTTKVKVPKKIK